MFIGDNWLECLLSIPLIAIVPFAAIIWAVRQAAPTDLVRTGALAGLVAGGVSATAYAFHCTDDSLPFVALWYGGNRCLVRNCRRGARASTSALVSLFGPTLFSSYIRGRRTATCAYDQHERVTDLSKAPN